MKKKEKLGLIILILAVLFTLFIFARSLKDASESSVESDFVLTSFLGGLINKMFVLFDVKDKDYAIAIIRKIAHYVEYFYSLVLYSSYFAISKDNIKKYIPWLLFIGLFSGCIDEAIQLTVPGRAGAVIDVFVDFSGAVSGILFSLLVFEFVKYKIQKKTAKG